MMISMTLDVSILHGKVLEDIWSLMSERRSFTQFNLRFSTCLMLARPHDSALII